MKFLVFAAMTVFAVMAFVPEADAVVCARGVRGAACAGHRGVAVAHRPVAVAHRPVVVHRRVVR
ncbi:hypothetical protein SAMN05519103_09592 [Rhizobiales bacterium GAS113]|nr:hypothetical protein SAMN05519103_09592 [Rhizobiales bacterium GAS113]